MKFSLLLSFFLVIGISTQAQTWNWSTDNPVPGQDVVVTLRNIDIDEDMHIVGYYFHGKDLVSSDINFIEENGGLKMTLKVPEQTNWLRIVVKDKNNEPVAGDNRDIAYAGAPAGSSLIDYANATAAYYRLMGLTREETVVTKMYRDAIAANPAWLDNPVVLRQYYMMAKAAKAHDDLQKISSHITVCESKPDGLSQELLISSIRIAKDSGDSILVASLRRKLDTVYPQSLLSQEDQFNQFRKATTLADKILLREKFKATYPITDMNKGLYDQMTATIVDECATMNDWTKADEYLSDIMDPTTKARICNTYAWSLAGEGLEKEAPQLELAEKFSSASLNILSSDTKPPATLSKSEWERNLEFSRAMYGDTYALILYKQGKYADAVNQQQKALNTYGYQDPEMNERYAIYLEKAGNSEEAISFIEDRIKEGTASVGMKATHERIWTGRTQEQLYDRYVAELEGIAKAKRLEEIKAMWMDAEASSFSLKDMEGKQVSLADYKGKTVVLDFWATWCGPCKASFPGMKNAVEHFAADKDVVFLFVDTWETGENIPDKVKKFITDNNYPFHVLMDGKNEVVTKYKVEGIPTKFIIDPNQKIRFKSVGYSGNNEVLVEELITMIEMARNNGKLIKS